MIKGTGLVPRYTMTEKLRMISICSFCKSVTFGIAGLGDLYDKEVKFKRDYLVMNHSSHALFGSNLLWLMRVVLSISFQLFC